jgi:hypothetical protein
MTARSSTTAAQRADEMRARILGNPEAWAAIRRPARHEYAPADFLITSDDRRQPLSARDPRAIEAEYREHRLAFWNLQDAGAVRLVARRAVVLARHLARRAVDPERDRVA